MNALTKTNTLKLDEAEYKWDSSQESCSNSYIWQRVHSLLPKEKSVILDVGCGNGFLTSKIAELGHKVVGIDSSRSGIEQASKAFPNTQFFCQSAYEDLRDVTQQVDCVVSSEVIEHLMQPKLYLRNIRDVLKPGGIFIVTTPYHGYLKNMALSLLNGWDRHFSVDWDGGHVKFFSRKSLKQMLQGTGFSDITFHPAGRFWGMWKSIVFRAKKTPC